MHKTELDRLAIGEIPALASLIATCCRPQMVQNNTIRPMVRRSSSVLCMEYRALAHNPRSARDRR